MQQHEHMKNPIKWESCRSQQTRICPYLIHPLQLRTRGAHGLLLRWKWFLPFVVGFGRPPHTWYDGRVSSLFPHMMSAGGCMYTHSMSAWVRREHMENCVIRLLGTPHTSYGVYLTRMMVGGSCLFCHKKTVRRDRTKYSWIPKSWQITNPKNEKRSEHVHICRDPKKWEEAWACAYLLGPESRVLMIATNCCKSSPTLWVVSLIPRICHCAAPSDLAAKQNKILRVAKKNIVDCMKGVVTNSDSLDKFPSLPIWLLYQVFQK